MLIGLHLLIHNPLIAAQSRRFALSKMALRALSLVPLYSRESGRDLIDFSVRVPLAERLDLRWQVRFDVLQHFARLISD